MGARLSRTGARRIADHRDAALEETRFRRRSNAACTCSTRRPAGWPTAQTLPGDVAFRLYDTFGFPLDLTQDALRERGHGRSTSDGFNAAMAEQQRRARAAWAGSGEAATESVWFDLAGAGRRHRIPRLRHRDGRGRDHRPRGRRQAASTRAEPASRGRGAAQPDARSTRNPAARSAIPASCAGGRRSRSSRHAEEARRAVRASRARVVQGRRASATPCRLEVDHARRVAHPRPSFRDAPAARGAAPGAGRRMWRRRARSIAPDRLRFDVSHPKPMSGEDLRLGRGRGECPHPRERRGRSPA